MNRPESGNAHLDALRLSETVRRRLVEFSADDSFSRDEALSQICRKIWTGSQVEGGLLSDLWVEGAFPAKCSDVSLDALVRTGHFDADLTRILDESGAIPRDRVLYEHQKEAILKCQAAGNLGARPSVVVTAGTGAGKTECFLLPILNELFRRPSPGLGIKCLILYPMNALVNDQVDRLYGWLRGQSRVTLFHFTSETPENKRWADNDRVPNWEACRFRTRQEARGLEDRSGAAMEGGPLPDILITNYSMLEYMLCRPQDNVFFGAALKAIVLDEAHLYMGTLAAEITLLLRRLYVRCGVEAANVLQIATSATLGSGAAGELQNFAGTIFTKDVGDVHVIVGESERAPLGAPIPPLTPVSPAQLNERQWISEPLIVADQTGTMSLLESPDQCDALSEQLLMLTEHRSTDHKGIPARALHEALSRAPIVHRLEALLWHRKRAPLAQLAAEVWGDDDAAAQAATVALLQLTASARTSVSSYPLIPHRLHLLVRPTDGLSVCLNQDCSGPPHLRLSPLGCVTAGQADNCPHCDAAMLLLHRCSNCGEWLLAGHSEGNRYRPILVDRNRLTFFTTRTVEAAAGLTLTLSTATAERTGSGGAGLQVTTVTSCPECGDDDTPFRPFSSGPAITLAILAETLLAEAPSYPGQHNAFLPARGRRLLAFSDSRQQAARLGPGLTRQHEIQLVRAAIAQALSQELAADPATLEFLRGEIERLVQALDGATTPALKQKIERDLASQRRQLEAHSSGGSLAEWAAALVSARSLAELLDADDGRTHQASYEQPNGTVRPWALRDWERNWTRTKAQIRTHLAREFATPSWRALSLETLGLAEITYAGLDSVQLPDALSGILPSHKLRSGLQAIWSDLLAALCDTLRVDGAVTLGSDEANWSFESGGAPIGQWSARNVTGPGLRRFVGQTPRQSRRRFIAAVISSCEEGLLNQEDLARQVLAAAFDQLASMAKQADQPARENELLWLEQELRQADDGSSAAAIRIVFGELGLRRPPKLFRCERTGHVWPRSVAGCAPESGCSNTLRAIADQDVDADPRRGRLRREYRESPVFRIGLWAEEHSAQLSPQQNRRLQDLFKAGIRNILSATTTLELGIDIGGLALALLGNVPPGKANYLQRAGRAGRRADGSSAVVTFARSRPFDREVFRRFGDYLQQPLRKPMVFLDRRRVVRRHLHAYLLGEFFREQHGPADRKGAMNAFGDMSRFCGKPRATYWQNINEVPALTAAPPSLEARFLAHLFDLRDHGTDAVRAIVKMLFQNSALAGDVDHWPALIQEAIDSFQRSIRDWNDDYELLVSAWVDAVGNSNKPQANAIQYQLRTLADMTVIEALADRQFLPSYGFPIGLQKLRIIVPDESNPRRIREEDQFRLERSGVTAVAEYVPGSRLMAAGKLITSRGLLKHWTGASLDNSPGLRGQFCQCVNDHSYYWIAGDVEDCPICEGPPKRATQPLLFVKHGFTSAAWDPPVWSTDVDPVGTAETVCVSFRPHAMPSGSVEEVNFAGITGLRAEYRESGELLVLNRGDNKLGFAICLRCGYAESEGATTGSGQMNLPSRFIYHAPITSTRVSDICWRDGGQQSVMRGQILSARETTDVLLLDFTNCLGPQATDEALVTTLAYAFRNAAANLLELDSRELGVIVVPTGPAGITRGGIIYDAASGGAGHVRELLVQGEQWVAAARRVLFVDDEHHRRCESGCLDCLLTYDAQAAMTRRPFVRRQAYEALSAIL